MEALIGIGGVVLVLALLGILSRIEGARRRRMIADVSRPAAVRRFDLTGELLPSEDVSLSPVSYRSLPSADPVGYVQTTQQARHTPTIETVVIVPALTAVGSAVALTMIAAGLALLFGWPARTLLIIFAVSVGGAWFWRLGFADKVLWRVESWTGKDVNGDGTTGRPSLQFATVNGGAARARVAQQSAQNATEARQTALQTFCDVCFLHGTSEGAHGITASGPDRDAYTVCRDELMKLGLAAWKNPNRPRGGWRMVADPATTKAVVGNHVA